MSAYFKSFSNFYAVVSKEYRTFKWSVKARTKWISDVVTFALIIRINKVKSV